MNINLKMQTFPNHYSVRCSLKCFINSELRKHKIEDALLPSNIDKCIAELFYKIGLTIETHSSLAVKKMS